MIRNLRIYSVFNSKYMPAVMVKVQTDDGFYSASVPSGTSRGMHEARELPVQKARKAFSKIRPVLIGRDERDWRGIDDLLLELDGTACFSKAGGNLSLAISLACARAALGGELWKMHKPRMGMEFPIPVANIIGGGAHGGGTDWQEFLVIPHHAKSPAEAMEAVISIWSLVGEEVRKKGLLLGRNVENAWMTKLDDLKTLDMLSDFADDWKVKMGIDLAASRLWNGRSYAYRKLGKSLAPAQQVDFVEEIAEKYKLYYLEDPVQENAFRQSMILNHRMGKDRIVIGDDLYCTSPSRLRTGIKNKSGNGIIVKPNQAGTLSLADQVVRIAKENDIVIVPSHRSGETQDNWLADLAVAWGAPFIKSGVKEFDMTKMNRLIELWEEIPDVKMAGLPV
jgi:enolase